ncbi:MAG: sodium:alanine symporter family protein [Candidatus Omnitrophica bacterium]|jgi:AGCS family alanine or glycine:cation symporter|nr:sodium:alanine symporter family protein [Candidatus Omnitrophota bacterium]
MEILEKIFNAIDGYVWGVPMLILLMGTHIFLTFRLGFVQKYLFRAIKISVSRHKEGDGDISHFGALTTALAATIGTGNIVGVGTAIAAGGPGAVFWMWLTGIFGIATKYAEAVLSVKYRTTSKDGSIAGGPMYVLERGMHCRWLGVVFAVFASIAAFGIGNMVQSNSIAVLVKDTFHISPWITGLVLTGLTAAVIIGGIRSIAKVCERFVPVMAIFYVLGCLIILALEWKTIPDSIGIIFKSAFTGQAAIGGFLGAGMKEAMRFGIARGLFSNESGLGSAPIVAAAAQTKHPARQALVSSTGTFWDTVVICALTGIVLVNSGVWTEGLNGALLVKTAFGRVHFLGSVILTIGLLTFVFSTILGWFYYGEKSAEYLFGHRVIKPYRWLWIIAVMTGSVAGIPLVWSFADIANALMALPNLISLLVLSGVAYAETRDYLDSDMHSA